MFRIFSVLGFLFRELFFKDPSEYDFRSPKFNARRVSVVAFLFLAIVSNAILLERLYVVGVKNVRLKELLRQCLDKSNDDDSSNSVVRMPVGASADALRHASVQVPVSASNGCMVYDSAAKVLKTPS